MESKIQSSINNSDENSNSDSEKSIDFKSNFARSLSVCDSFDNVENYLDSNKINGTITEFSIVNDFNKSDEDKEKQLWTMTKKKQQRQVRSVLISLLLLLYIRLSKKKNT
jgi:hypothetical protein